MTLTESGEELQHGAIAPAFTLPCTDGGSHSLDELKGEKATLVVFMCNHCPFVKPKLVEINRIADDFMEQGVTVIGINSNDAVNYPEDSFENMQKLVEEKELVFPYLHDESQAVAKAYKAKCTPDPYLFDKDLKLVHHGRIDDVHGDKPVNAHELYEVIKEFFSTGKITQEEHPSMGCNIKWKE